MNRVKVPGKNNKHKVLMYAISTCPWCKMTKKFLKDSDVEFEYVDVDLSSVEDRKKIRSDIVSRGGEPIYPTIIVDDKVLITGLHKDKIAKALEV